MTATLALPGLLDHLPAISLAELQADAAFLTRQDRKYLVSLGEIQRLFANLDPMCRVLEIDGRRSFTYVTPYFDDDCMSSYLAAARRRPNRFKVRTRLYTNSGLCQLEVKVRDSRGRTVKKRTAHIGDSLTDLSIGERTWLGAFPQVAPYSSELRHRLTTHYERTTIVLPGNTARVTVDCNLRFELPDGTGRAIPHIATIETKGSGGPTWFDRLLWSNGFRPEGMSKFACGLSLLHPELPANRWHRLRTRLDAASLPVAPAVTAHSA